jgi:hypothetical protein
MLKTRILLSTDFQPEIDAILRAVDANTKMIFCVRLITQQEIRFQMKV